MAIVRFYGDLEKYGKRFNLDVMTAGEALKALLFQMPGLQRHMNNGLYRLRISGEDISEKDLKKSMSSVLSENAVIHIVPKVIGAKNGIFSFIAGAILVVVGIIISGASYGSLSAFSGPMIGIGVGLMAGGLVSMLTKLPQTNIDDSTTNNNTSFSNLDNAVTQGQPIPLCYGEMMIGSKTLSQGIRTE